MTPHDRLFRHVFSQPEQAAPQLRAALPRAIASRLRWDTLAPEPVTWVDAALQERRADLLFSARSASRRLRVRLLYEHKSEADGDLPLQILGYLVRSWEAQRAKQESPLALTIPVVVTNAPRWRAPLRLSPSFRGPAVLLRAARRYIPDFEYVLVDLRREDPLRMGLRGQGEVALTLLKHARDGDLWERFAGCAGVPRAVQESGLGALEPLLRYVTFVDHGPPPPSALATLERRAGRKVVDQVKSWGEQLLEQGHREGHKEGHKEGRKEGHKEGHREGHREGRIEGVLDGERAIVRRLLERRYGPLPAWAEARVAAADAPSLETWAERLLTAGSLPEVFA